MEITLLPRLVLAPTISVFLAFAPAFAQSQESSPPPSQAIRVSVDRVNVGVVVTDSRGHFVEGLRREDFHVFDDGIEQPLTDFAAIDEPAQVLLLVEAGPAVYLLESGHVSAAHALLDGLLPGDRVAVAKYAEAPQGLLDFTADKQAVAGALESLQFNLGFGMLNLSSSVSTVLDWLGAVQGKKTMVLLSTGIDTSPDSAIAATLARLKSTDVRLLAISLGGELRTHPAKPHGKNKSASGSSKSAVAAQQFAEADRLLSAMAEATGGRAYFPKSTKDFAAVYSQIAQLVRHEYSLAFAPPARDGRLHSIEVRISAATQFPTVTSSAPAASEPAYRTDSRRAYLAPAP